MESKLIINVSDEETGERIDSFLSGKTEFTTADKRTEHNGKWKSNEIFI